MPSTALCRDVFTTLMLQRHCLRRHLHLDHPTTSNIRASRHFRSASTTSSTPLRSPQKTVIPPASSPHPSSPSPRRPRLQWFVSPSSLFYFFNAMLCAHLVWAHVITIRPTSGPSMLPTFEVADDFAVISYLHRRGRWIKAGDLVTFDHPVRGQRYPSIKRVIGMPGDFVLRDTPLPAGSPASSAQVMIQVPEGHVYIAGDNVEWSRDSRHYGPLPMALVKGKVLAKYSGRGSGWKWFASPYQDVELKSNKQDAKLGFCEAGARGASWAGDADGDGVK